LGLEAAQRGERHRREAVLRQVLGVRVLEQRRDVVACVVDEAERAAVAPLRVVDARGAKPGEDVGVARAFGGKVHPGNSSKKRLAMPVKRTPNRPRTLIRGSPAFAQSTRPVNGNSSPSSEMEPETSVPGFAIRITST